MRKLKVSDLKNTSERHQNRKFKYTLTWEGQKVGLSNTINEGGETRS